MRKVSSPSNLLGSTLLFFFSVTSALACMCPGYVSGSIADEVKAAVEGSSAVFLGKVIGFEYRKGVLFEREGVTRSTENTGNLETKLVKFQVERWWKMELPSETMLVTDITRNLEKFDELTIAENTFRLPAGDVWNMCHTPFMTDQSYLVYASGDPRKLQYRYCTRTTSISKAVDDLAVLGEGRAPKPKDKN